MLTLRPATSADIPALQNLITRAVTTLQAPHYTEAQRAAALGSVFGVDQLLIADGTYLLAEHGPNLAGAGGWSFRATLFGSDRAAARDNTALRPGVDAARIRAFFVDPAYARQGVASAILRACEAAARAAGFTEAELGATLTGLPLYRAHGYAEVAPVAADLPGGGSLAIIQMRKRIG